MQPTKPARKGHQLSTALTASRLSDQKVANPLPGTQLRS
jgi:hypothetical protein